MSLSRASRWILPALLAGCNSLAGAPRPVEVYDLGPGQEPRTETALVGNVQVLAPTWLRTTAMQYRLSYASAAQRHSYLESRWAAPPAELLLGVLGRSLGGEGGCKLEIELDEFIQDHPATGRSDGVIEVRARLRGGSTLANRDFHLRLPSASPDATGGVAALGRGTRQLSGELGAWLAELAQDARIREGCGRP